MAREMVYVIGAPGVGKSTSVKRALPPPMMEYGSPFAHAVMRGGTMLGVLREPFGGTDALPLDVQPRVIDWLDKRDPASGPVVAEGDRLANGLFFDAVSATGYSLYIIHITCAPEIAAARLQGRGDSNQMAQEFVEGRQTKVARLAEQWSAYLVPNDEEDAHETLRGLRLFRAMWGERGNGGLEIPKTFRTQYEMAM